MQLRIIEQQKNNIPLCYLEKIKNKFPTGKKSTKSKVLGYL